MNHLFERESMVNPTSKPGITGTETTFATLYVGVTAVDPDEHCVDLHTRDHESRLH
jgi:hypothetical protein